MTATQCPMCKAPIEGQSFQSELYNKPVCEDCARAIHAATRQLHTNGVKAGWGEMRKEKAKP